MIDDGRVDDTLAYGGGDCEAEHEKRDEVEERRPGDCPVRAHGAGGDDRGDRVGGVVKAVEKVEREREQYQEHHDLEADRHADRVLDQEFSMTMPSMILATSSHLSVTASGARRSP